MIVIRHTLSNTGCLAEAGVVFLKPGIIMRGETGMAIATSRLDYVDNEHLSRIDRITCVR